MRTCYAALMKPSFSVAQLLRAMWLQKVACIELSDSMINGQANSIRTGIGSAIVEREQAAAYCSLSPGTFSRWVSQGLLPKAILGTARWDLKAIDSAINSLSGLEHIEQSALDLWRANVRVVLKGIHTSRDAWRTAR